jgi:YVTN family beta-propeller protein
LDLDCVYVATADGKVLRLNTADKSVTATVALAGDPRSLALSPDGKELFTVSPGEDALVVLDAKTLRVVSRIPVGRPATRIAFGRRIGLGALQWDRRVAEVALGPGEKSARFVFGFSNNGERPVHITDMSTSCRCTTADLSKKPGADNAWAFAPAEIGSLYATIDIGTHTGRVTKTVTINTDDPAEPQVELTVHAVVPAATVAAAAPAANANAGEKGSTALPAAAVLAPPKAAAPAKRPPDQILADLAALDRDLRQLLPAPRTYLDEPSRNTVAPKAVPIITRMLPLYDELVAAEPTTRDEADSATIRLLSLLTLMGDAGGADRLAKLAGGGSPGAQAAQMTVQWWKANKDAAQQFKIASQFAEVAKANPSDPGVMFQAVTMLGQGPASRATKVRIEQIILDDLKGDGPRQLAERIEANRARRTHEGKPITLAGDTLEGKPFSTDGWKGRVIVVDFWATSCAACKQDLPMLRALYDRYHDKGLEIVGVPSDRKAELVPFMQTNKDIAWPQLPMKGPPGFHKLAKDYQMELSGIPVRFVIDRKGTLRSAEAGDDLEELIASLLAEKE